MISWFTDRNLHFARVALLNPARMRENWFLASLIIPRYAGAGRGCQEATGDENSGKATQRTKRRIHRRQQRKRRGGNQGLPHQRLTKDAMTDSSCVLHNE